MSWARASKRMALAAMPLLKPRAKTLEELAFAADPFLRQPPEMDPKASRASS